MGRLDGKVAFVTGAARGQGRSHAIELAREGADVIAVDVAHDLPELGLGYPMGSAEELAETAAEVEKLDRRIVTAEVDVRDGAALKVALDNGVAELGRLDIVAANAGIAANAVPAHEITEDAWEQMLGINLTGVWKTCKAAVPHIVAGGRGGSMILTSSMAGLRGYQGIAAYSSAKHGVVGLMRVFAAELGQHSIRVNSVHPTQVDTPMVMNESTFKIFRPDLENPTREDFEPASASMHALPVPWADPLDISRALVFLASDDARLITGVPLPIDAGLLVK
ncbi:MULTISPECIES: mycofactocin-coupled SDR family oxidoreductase [unclassified Pseudonocardia]|uniref:mycofactocin-coupled SDR family oxidoreductase n=1 Tax=unclassified Pseudonocardia TaxID=2619320 RepID=UPI0001FFDE04|nr:mycofactocin-coupled SDR family oxidoreductase [Pseudonocardia sp. Ae707_Ps1]OLM08930.1 short-chain dehydrogenase/reductase SDR [Pseudonocardia sp. Ae707_Ps1]